MFLAALIVFIGTLPLAANPTTRTADRIVVSNETQFAALGQKRRLRLLIGLIRSGRYELAARLLQRYPMTGPHAANRTLFVTGMIRKARGDYKGAISNYRAALADDPNLSLIRMELAHTLYLTKQDDGAKHHLVLLRTAAPTTDVARQFDRFIEVIDARDPWSLDAYFSLAPSTNFNNGTSEQTVIFNGIPLQISGNSREKSGLGVRGGANGSYTLRTSKSLDFIASAGINFTEYDGNTFDDLIFSESLSAQKRTGMGTITGSIIITQRWSGIEEFSWTLGPQIALHQLIAPKVGLFSNLRHSIIDYKHADYRSGHKFSVDNRLSYSLFDATIAYLLVGGERSVSKRKPNDYWAASAGLGLYHEAAYGITVYGQAQLRRQWHEGIYPIINEARKDTRLSVDVSLTKRDFDIFGVTPRLQYSYVRNFSNSLFDRYESHGANLTLTKRY